MAALPNYLMQAFLIPKGTINELQRAIRTFFWRGDKECAPIHNLVSWGKACTPKNSGGLGLPDLQARNRALLLKSLWQIEGNDSRIWTSLLSELYETQGANDLRNIPCSIASYFVKDMVSVLPLFNVGLARGQPSRWRWTGDGIFNASSAYRFLTEPGIRCSWHHRFWTIKAPLKIKIFAWVAMQNKIPTYANLRKRGFVGPSMQKRGRNNKPPTKHVPFHTRNVGGING
ncbi:hypothetical protein LUZ60_001860 [Juncus effusus]|nr:hypothetical protein LUZ60_001860 [Juncus effusus]